MTLPELTPQQQQYLLDEWLREHQPHIDAAVFAALEQVDGVSDAMTSLGADDDQKVREKIEGALELAAQATLPEMMRDQFDIVFANEPDFLRETLKRQAEAICRERLRDYIDYLIERARTRRT